MMLSITQLAQQNKFLLTGFRSLIVNKCSAKHILDANLASPNKFLNYMITFSMYGC